MKNILTVAIPLMAVTPLNTYAAEDSQSLEHRDEAIEEVIVTATLHRSRAETALPVNVLAGEELRESISATLGETLQEQVGVNIASFGPSVGAPVIRGQGANRVQILQGGIGNIDASAISADHANSLEPALADRIEVLRGPSTLLFGNGAIGGVVNVIDNRIPTSLPEGLSGMIETRNNSANDQQVNVLKLEGGAGQFAWHVDAVHRKSNDVEIPGFAINPDTVDLSDSEAYEELIESAGRIGNTSARSSVQTFGGSWILDEGYIGLSFNKLENNYGIPAGSHDHGHEDEDEHHEDEDEHHDDEDEHHEDEHDEEEEGDIRIDMEQERADLELVLPLTGWFQEVHGRVGVVDYQHAEVEADGSIGTLFEQDGIEGRFAFHLAPIDNYESVVGLQFSHRRFSALGEEAFVPETDIDSNALFSVVSLERNEGIYEFGLRGERRDLSQVHGGCSRADTSWSGSGSAIWPVREDSNLLLSVAHSQRSATVEELFSNISSNCTALPEDLLVEHAATQRIEIGDPNAKKERSSNIDFGYRKHLGALTGEVNFYYNDIADYIYLQDSETFRGETEISQFMQSDAVFYGFEAEANFPLYRTGDHLSELTLFSDYVRAEFSSLGNVPRIPSRRVGAEWKHSHLDWQLKVRWTEVSDQERIGLHETETSGYSLLNFYADYHLQLDGRSAFLFLRGTNLLDENIRHHSSLLKDVAPAAGRSIELGFRVVL